LDKVPMKKKAGLTPLAIAANGVIKILCKCFAKGADVNAKTNRGGRSSVAKASNHKEVMAMLKLKVKEGNRQASRANAFRRPTEPVSRSGESQSMDVKEEKRRPKTESRKRHQRSSTDGGKPEPGSRFVTKTGPGAARDGNEDE
jgi:hypothetical protein